MFGLGLSQLLFKTTVGTVKTVTGFQPVKIPFLSDIPVLGEIFFSTACWFTAPFCWCRWPGGCWIKPPGD